MAVRQRGLLSVVVPAYDVAAYLPACLDSLLAQTHRDWEAVVVDDGSPDDLAAIAAAYARRDPRIRLVRTENHGLGAARNTGLAHTGGDLVAFLDSDDVLPPDAYATLVASLERTGSDLVTGSIARWSGSEVVEPLWMQRLHTPARTAISAADHPEVLGDVFAWNKVFRRSFWESAGLSWPEGVRYEDQPCTTEAFLRGRFDVLPDVVYHWRIRSDGTSITQQRSSLQDLADRGATKRMALASVTALGDDQTRRLFLDRVLVGDLWRYFVQIPGCPDPWWDLLASMVHDLWGPRSLVHALLPPVHRLTGWLVGHGRRADASAVMTRFAGLGGAPYPRNGDGTALDPLDLEGIPPEALALRPVPR